MRLSKNLERMLENFVWSFSSLSTYKKCPHSFYKRYILKDKRESPNTFFGSAMHKYAEKYASGRIVAPLDLFRYYKCLNFDKSEFLFCTTQIKKFIDTRVGEKRRLVEQYYNFTIGSYPFVCVIDLMFSEEDYLGVWDYKSSKSTDYVSEYRDQYALYFLGLNKIYPDKKLKFYFFFPRCNSILEKEDPKESESYFIDLIGKIEKDTEFTPRSSKLCKYCDYYRKGCSLYS